MRFLNQQYPLPLEYTETTKLRNFVVVYSIGLSNKVTLWLVCPKKYNADERISEAWWWIQIPDPALGVSGPTTPSNPPDIDIEAARPTIQEKKTG